MADIDVVAKKGGAGWMLWVVLALVAVVIVWLLMRDNDQAEREVQLNNSVRPGISIITGSAA